MADQLNLKTLLQQTLGAQILQPSLKNVWKFFRSWWFCLIFARKKYFQKKLWKSNFRRPCPDFHGIHELLILTSHINLGFTSCILYPYLQDVISILQKLLGFQKKYDYYVIYLEISAPITSFCQCPIVNQLSCKLYRLSLVK